MNSKRQENGKLRLVVQFAVNVTLNLSISERTQKDCGGKETASLV